MKTVVTKRRKEHQFDVLGATLASVVTNLGGGRALVENVTNASHEGSCFTIKLTSEAGQQWLDTLPLKKRQRVNPGETCALEELPWDDSEPMPYETLCRQPEWEPVTRSARAFPPSRVQRLAELVNWSAEDGPRDVCKKMNDLHLELACVHRQSERALKAEKGFATVRMYSEPHKSHMLARLDRSGLREMLVKGFSVKRVPLGAEVRSSTGRRLVHFVCAGSDSRLLGWSFLADGGLKLLADSATDVAAWKEGQSHMFAVQSDEGSPDVCSPEIINGRSGAALAHSDAFHLLTRQTSAQSPEEWTVRAYTGLDARLL